MEDEKLKRIMPRRFRFVGETARPFENANRYGVYFPGTDLCSWDMGGRGTGAPQTDVEWIDDPPEHLPPGQPRAV